MNRGSSRLDLLGTSPGVKSRLFASEIRKLPNIKLIGCTPITVPGESSHPDDNTVSHEIKLGSVKVGDEVTWTFSIVHSGGPGTDTVRYKIYPGTPDDFEWLSIEPSSGELSPSVDGTSRAKNVHVKLRPADPGFRLTCVPPPPTTTTTPTHTHTHTHPSSPPSTHTPLTTTINTHTLHHHHHHHHPS
jgi:hypothetical protein